MEGKYRPRLLSQMAYVDLRIKCRSMSGNTGGLALGFEPSKVERGELQSPFKLSVHIQEIEEGLESPNWPNVEAVVVLIVAELVASVEVLAPRGARSGLRRGPVADRHESCCTCSTV
jgi:hypothetical protein